MISILDLSIIFPTQEGPVKAVDHITFQIASHQKVALIGETGCGKTALGMGIMRLLPSSAIISGQIFLEDNDLLTVHEQNMQEIRGRWIAMIMQNPSLSLNPVLNIGDQISEKIVMHTRNKKKAKTESIHLLQKVGFPDPLYWAGRYPHELSGGMKQRVMIAMGLSCTPDLIIADEPTKSLDIDARNEIITLLQEVTRKTSLLLITHDLYAAREICNLIMVMYAGEIIESGPADEIMTYPKHPYTQAFIRAMPKNGLHSIQGSSPSLIKPPPGCRFHPRCENCSDKCVRLTPPHISVEKSLVSCWKWA